MASSWLRIHCPNLMNPSLARLMLVAAAIAALVLAIVWVNPPPVVKIQYVVATDATELLTPLINEFNRSGIEVDGQRVHVTPVEAPSGTALDQIGRAIKPVAWT